MNLKTKKEEDLIRSIFKGCQLRLSMVSLGWDVLYKSKIFLIRDCLQTEKWGEDGKKVKLTQNEYDNQVKEFKSLLKQAKANYFS